ncbi:MAG: hypothetical protein QM528_03090 [Phycisphaerales bacterium]|nr:hypothetical protein [Phycisphaerales bacterium]
MEVILICLVMGYLFFHARKYIETRTNENTNEHWFDFIPHAFPTLGILCTFIGIAWGLWHFDSLHIEESIPKLMDGLKTAFVGSIIGIGGLIFLSWRASIKKHQLEQGVKSEETKAIEKLIEAVNTLNNNQIDAINTLTNKLSFTNEDGQVVKPGNVLRDIYIESARQTNSLQTFSSDLALTISEGFQQILNNPNEGVVAELKLLNGEIVNLGTKIQAPATEGIEKIVRDLQVAMNNMVQEFRNAVNGSTITQMEGLARLIGQAANSLTDFPNQLAQMTTAINGNFEGLRTIVDNLGKQTQIQSQTEREAMIEHAKRVDELLKNRADALVTGQEGVITTQNNNLQLSEKLLTSFNKSIEQMTGLANGVTATTQELNLAHDKLGGLVSNLDNSSTRFGEAQNKFGEAQLTFARYSNDFLNNNTATITSIQEALNRASTLSREYAEQFALIKTGLDGTVTSIQTGLEGYRNTVTQSLEDYLGKYSTALDATFRSIQTGLEEYRNTVTESLENYLGRYSSALTNTAGSLETASTNLNETVEELIEQISKLPPRN